MKAVTKKEMREVDVVEYVCEREGCGYKTASLSASFRHEADHEIEDRRERRASCPHEEVRYTLSASEANAGGVAWVEKHCVACDAVLNDATLDEDTPPDVLRAVHRLLHPEDLPEPASVIRDALFEAGVEDPDAWLHLKERVDEAESQRELILEIAESRKAQRDLMISFIVDVTTPVTDGVWSIPGQTTRSEAVSLAYQLRELEENSEEES